MDLGWADKINTMRSLVALTLGVCLAGLARPNAATQPQVTVDDALVLRAIIDHTILPEIRRSGSARANEGIALVAGQTSGMCSASPPCRIPEQWHRLLTVPGLIDKSGETLVGKGVIIMERMIASLEARNAQPQPLPSLDHPRVVMTAARPLSKALRGSLANAIGITSLSLPGYSGDGLALVYGAYASCDSTCGTAWLFVVRKVGDTWQVQSATVTATS